MASAHSLDMKEQASNHLGKLNLHLVLMQPPECPRGLGRLGEPSRTPSKSKETERCTRSIMLLESPPQPFSRPLALLTPQLHLPLHGPCVFHPHIRIFLSCSGGRFHVCGWKEFFLPCGCKTNSAFLSLSLGPFK